MPGDVYCLACSLRVARPVTLDEARRRIVPVGATPALPPGFHTGDHCVVVAHRPRNGDP